ncbi:insulinase family protein [Neoehrlichia mikurensis]|uniref:Insulinase family protein n=1 Tax=Neoehrlichia mikurensis TaxID=89586 RepID=A0A9Q9F4C6_9RICK|nr:pitrilysin family protein [Neoehrlichia mikurensis]QXK91639.1 insulinase family protein [Neoehrlichia mikurensis]QXK92850.1 insulinase family protein [Neoehrlichia mikurensis]QXK93330.1 insulinase family protein [Neoehrlichia mikurensis]UTO55728.1 insulinase family protein [Neoehrlichia mikurensis]UTO56645.1 insulinase family protein [Neoehrlichia mikurensis]
MIMRILIVLLYAVCVCDTALSLSTKILHTKLDNGMEIYVLPNNNVPVVMHMIIYKVGGIDDPYGYSGLAHFFEHLMFSGTDNFADFASTINSIGGEFNAMTSSYSTIYYELVNKQYLPLVMQIESDRMHNLKITDKAMKRERSVVLEERKMRIDSNPHGVITEEMMNAFYRNGYGRSVAGWEHEIKNFNREESERFYNTYYNPNNAILFISGDVNFDDVIKLSKKYYGNIKNKVSTIKRVPKNLEPPHKANIAVTLYENSIQNPEIFVTYKAPSIITNGNYHVMYLIADLLGNNAFGALYNALVLGELATSVSVSYGPDEYSDGFITIHVVPKSGISLKRIEHEIYSVINNFSVKDDSFFSLKKTSTTANIVYALDGLKAMSFFYASNLALGVPLIDVQEFIKKIEGIDKKDVDVAIKDTFSGTRLVGYLLPKKEFNNE